MSLDMKTTSFNTLIITLFLLACNAENRSDKISSLSEKYGGLFAYNEINTVKSVFPASLYYQSEIQLVSNISEPLVRMESDMSLKPCLAENWTIAENGLVYIFDIRKNVFFHDDPCFKDGKGKELSAQDVEFSFLKACEDFGNNTVSHYLRGVIKGANEYFEGKSKNLSGVKVLDEFKIQFTLEKPFSEFIAMLSNPGLSIYPKEYFQLNEKKIDYHLVGTGPFKIANYERDEILVLERNNQYWAKDDDGKSLPYLDGIKVTFDNDKKKELQAFENSLISFMTDIPNGFGDQENTQFRIEKNHIMGTKFLGLFMPNEILSNKQFRKALQYSINKEYLVDSILNKVGKPAHGGILPPIFSDYKSEPEIGYEYNVKSAKHSLELSGLDSNELKGLSIMTTNRETDILLAEKIRDMLRESLGLLLTVKYFHPDEYYELLEQGRGTLFIDGYFGDYPSPENFLHTLFYGKYVPESLDEFPGYNIYRYKNPFYDNQLDSARYTQSGFKKNVYFQKAERLLMLDAVIVPLYYFEYEYAIDSKIQGFEVNPLKTFDLRTVYFKQ